MRIHQFTNELWLRQSREEIFPFFADVGNLNALTPPWLNFQILTPQPLRIHEGALIDYRLRVRGFPLRWRTRITAWEPPRRFVDEQLRGPYRQWIHEHTFEEADGGTLVRDKVDYAVPLDFLIHQRMVRPDLEKIFQFRSLALANRFGS